MSEIAYPKKFIISNGDTVIFKGERYSASVNEHCEVSLKQEDGIEIIKMSRVKRIDKEFKGSRDILLEAIFKYFNISKAELQGGKSTIVVLARRVTCLILNDEGVHSEVIADAIGRDRTSVYANLKKAEEMETYDKGLYNAYLTIKSML